LFRMRFPRPVVVFHRSFRPIERPQVPQDTTMLLSTEIPAGQPDS